MLKYKDSKKSVKARQQILIIWLKSMVNLTLCWNYARSERVQDDCVHCVWQSSATKAQQSHHFHIASVQVWLVFTWIDIALEIQF